MPKQRTSPGDATGRKRQQLQKEHADELAARGDEISLAQAEEAERVEHGVFDPATGRQVDDDAEAFRTTASAALAPGTRQVGDPATTVDEEGILYAEGQEELGVQTNDTPVIGVGQETPFPVPGGVPNDELVRDLVDRDSYAARRAGVGPDGVQDLGVQQASEKTQVIRVNTTLEDVTIGVGTSYTFEEGKKYRVPQHVADHLEEKGYVWH